MAKAIINVDIDLNTAPIEDLEQELESVNAQLKKVDQNSDAFKELSTRAGEVTNKLDKASKAAAGFTDEKKFMAADGAIKVMAGSLAGVVGTLGLIGVESEAFGEMEKKAASAIAVVIGVKDISEGFKQLRESTVLATAATKLFGKVSRTALLSTGIGAIVVALGTIVAYWDEINEFLAGASKEQIKLNKETERYEELSNRELGILGQQKELLELQGKETSAINRQLRSELILQNQKLQILYDQLAVQLELQKEAAKEVTFGETALAFLKDRFGIQALGLSLAESMNENNEETEETETKMADIQTKILNNKKAIQTIDNEEGEKEEERNSRKLVTVANIGMQAAGLADVLDQEKALIESTDIKNQTDALATSQTKKLTDAYKAQKAADEAKNRVTMQGVAALGSLSMALGQGTAAGKTAAIAEIAITTGIGFAKALEIAQKSAAGTGPAAAFAFPIFYATQLAAVLGAVGQAKTILSGVQGGPAVPVSVQGGGAPSAPPRGGIAGPAAASSPVPEITSIQPTVKAYVVSGEVNTAQEADARLNRRRSLG